METLCKIRDLARMISKFEQQFEEQYNLSLNEGMLLCTLYPSETLMSGELAQALGLSNSNASKVIRATEAKNYIKRSIGETDKRQMCFSLTDKGSDTIKRIKNDDIEIPLELLNIIKHL